MNAKDALALAHESLMDSMSATASNPEAEPLAWKRYRAAADALDRILDLLDAERLDSMRWHANNSESDICVIQFRNLVEDLSELEGKR